LIDVRDRDLRLIRRLPPWNVRLEEMNDVLVLLDDRRVTALQEQWPSAAACATYLRQQIEQFPSFPEAHR
jgi:hypothetical protein